MRSRLRAVPAGLWVCLGLAVAAGLREGWSLLAIVVGALSDSDGGVILLGVRDDGTVRGLDVDGDMIARTHRTLATLATVRNSGRHDVTPLLVGDRTVVVLPVRRRLCAGPSREPARAGPVPSPGGSLYSSLY